MHQKYVYHRVKEEILVRKISLKIKVSAKKLFSIFQRQQVGYGILPAQVILVSIWR